MLSDVTLVVRPGTVHALLGENGAGKTTLMRIAYGMLHADHGSISIDGIERRIRSPADAIRQGIGMVHQHFALVPAMTVAENIALGLPGRYHPRAVTERVNQLARSSGLPVEPGAYVRDLPVPAQQRVEILKAIASSARVLILDEPTAVLPPGQAAELLQWLRAYVTTGNHAVVLITHKLDEARAVADDITVLRGGRSVFAGSAQGSSDRVLIEAIVGATVEATERPTPVSIDRVVRVRARNLTLRNQHGVVSVNRATFDLLAGEIIGVAGIEGAGQYELLRCLSGRMPPDSGELQLPERIAYLPDDRARDALIDDFDLAENFVLHGASRRRGIVPWRSLRLQVQALLTRFDVRAPNVRAPIRVLSGGNQQKFLLMRELSDDPELLVAVNPTRGLDVRATMALRAYLQEARDRGITSVVYSTDIDELLGLADRILVVASGNVTEVEASREPIGRAMVGAPA
ncbi:MAG: ATP-binding cassette domain-containing protein [Gemmatimonadaceae bacterium]